MLLMNEGPGLCSRESVCDLPLHFSCGMAEVTSITGATLEKAKRVCISIHRAPWTCLTLSAGAI